MDERAEIDGSTYAGSKVLSSHSFTSLSARRRVSRARFEDK